MPCLYTRISILLSQLPILIPRFLGPIISSCSSPDSTAMLRSTLESVLFMIDDLSNTRHNNIIEGRTKLHKVMANSRACRLAAEIRRRTSPLPRHSTTMSCPRGKRIASNPRARPPRNIVRPLHANAIRDRTLDRENGANLVFLPWCSRSELVPRYW